MSSAVAQTISPPTDSVSDTAYISRFIRYSKNYPFINYERNCWEWTDSTDAAKFFRKLEKSPVQRVKVLHIGDSHIQADFFTGYIREHIQPIFGFSGRGMVFPYACAQTHSTYDYRTNSYGQWECSRNTFPDPLAYNIGISGATVHTSDSTAGFRFIFREGIIQPEFNTIKIYCKTGPGSFDLRVKCSGTPDTLLVLCSHNVSHPYVTLQVPSIGDTIEVWMHQSDTTQHSFESYGLCIESNRKTGILYNSVGINGAGYRSILHEELFLTQLADMQPDLVIIDLGANDFYPRNIQEPEFTDNLLAIIHHIRTTCPSASIMLTNSQDIQYRRRFLPQCRQFEQITRATAKKEHCIYYDYYDVAGGEHSMNDWYKYGLAQHGRVHLNGRGYNIKGELCLDAMLNAYKLFLSGEMKDTLLMNPETTVDVNFSTPARDTAAVAYPEPDYIYIYHKVRSGETLGGIAMEYHVSVAELKKWNHLQGNMIRAGATLKIRTVNKAYHPVHHTSAPATATTHTTHPASGGSSSTTYTVKDGDSLWLIAHRYGTTVEKIKSANHLTNDNLHPGMKLVIPR